MLYRCFYNLQCLHNPQAQLERRSVVITFCNDLLSRLIPKVEDEDQVLEDIDNNLDTSISESPDPENLPVAKKLQLAIDASLQISYRNHYEKKTLPSIANCSFFATGKFSGSGLSEIDVSKLLSISSNT